MKSKVLIPIIGVFALAFTIFSSSTSNLNDAMFTSGDNVALASCSYTCRPYITLRCPLPGNQAVFDYVADYSGGGCPGGPNNQQ